MNRYFIFPLALGILMLTGFVTPPDPDDKVLIVQLNTELGPKQADCTQAKYEMKTVTQLLDTDNPLTTPDDPPDDDDKLADAGCFVPNLKLVYKDYTYVLSTYCTSSHKYKNSAPFVNSDKEMPSDFVFSEVVLNYLQKVMLDNFKPDYHVLYKQLATGYKPSSAKVFNLSEIYEKMSQDNNVNQDLDNATKERESPDAQKDLEKIAKDAGTQVRQTDDDVANDLKDASKDDDAGNDSPGSKTDRTAPKKN